jgi:hypothetical protein
MEESMNKELLKLLVVEIHEDMRRGGPNTKSRFGKFTQGTIGKLSYCLRNFGDELPNWIDIEDKKTRTFFKRLPCFGPQTMKFLEEVVRMDVVKIVQQKLEEAA